MLGMRKEKAEERRGPEFRDAVRGCQASSSLVRPISGRHNADFQLLMVDVFPLAIAVAYRKHICCYIPDSFYIHFCIYTSPVHVPQEACSPCSEANVCHLLCLHEGDENL